MNTKLILLDIRSLINRSVVFLFPPFLLKLMEIFLFPPFFLLAKWRIEPYSKLHLGCGTNILKGGWANIDLSGGLNVIKWDCTKRLPVKSGTIRLIFSEHFLEHINMQEGRKFLSECYRVIQPGGVLRISTPNLKKCIDEYLLGYASEWRNIEYSENTGPLYTPCRMMNESMRLWGHKFVYDLEELNKLLKEIGFSSVTEVAWHESKHEELKNIECRPFGGEIILEIVK